MRQDDDVREMDEAVERVLAGLREVQPREGLEQRVMAAMQSAPREDAVGLPIWRRGWAWGVAAALLMAAGVSVVVHLRYAGGAPGHSTLAASDAPQRRAAVPAKTIFALEAVNNPRRGSAVKSKPVKAPQVLSAIDELALEEARAPSMPAPPEPLTAQERRLRRAAQRGGPEEEMAALNPVMREQRYEAAKAAVMEFFEPPRPQDVDQE